MLLRVMFLISVIIELVPCFPIPPNDKALFNDDEGPEDRGKRRRRPCKGRSDPEGRTFFDWSYQYLDVNYNYNYNINCGGSGGGGGGNKPGLGGGGNKPGLGGGGNKPGGGLFSGHHQGGGLLGGGLFGGNHEGEEVSGGNKPQSGGSHGGGLFGGNGPFGIFSQSQSQSPSQDAYTYFKPGQYLVAHNPIFGDFVHDLSAFNPSTFFRQNNKGVNSRLAKS